MEKKEYQELRNNEDRELIKKYPELNQSGIYDNEGNKLPKEKREQYDPIPRGFINSYPEKVFFKLTAKDIYIYFFLSSKCNPWRNTTVKSEKINEETGIPEITIERALRRLEFYHFIKRRTFYINPKRKKRITYLLRWDTAYKGLIKEGKIKAISDKKIIFITPYLPNKFKKAT